jgi:hypothetical protein
MAGQRPSQKPACGSGIGLGDGATSASGHCARPGRVPRAGRGRAACWHRLPDLALARHDLRACGEQSVRSLLGRDGLAGQVGASRIPFVQGGPKRAARVVEWRPPGAGEARDVAVLELEAEVEIEPCRLAKVSPPLGWPFRTTGFPEGHDDGLPARGTLEEAIEHGRRTARGDWLPGFFIRGGCSGAPINDGAAGVVLGMAAAAILDERERTAFIIPVEHPTGMGVCALPSLNACAPRPMTRGRNRQPVA